MRQKARKRRAGPSGKMVSKIMKVEDKIKQNHVVNVTMAAKQLEMDAHVSELSTQVAGWQRR